MLKHNGLLTTLSVSSGRKSADRKQQGFSKKTPETGSPALTLRLGFFRIGVRVEQ